MKIITDTNIDKLIGMSYSDNINTLLQSDKSSKDTITDYIANMKYKLNAVKRLNNLPNENPILPSGSDLENESELGEEEYNVYKEYEPNSPEYNGDPAFLETPETPENLLREEQPDGTIKVSQRFSPLLNSIFINMTKEDKLQLLMKSEDEQLEELKRLYKIEFLSKSMAEQEGILRKLTYNNSQYDVDRLAEYLRPNSGKGLENDSEVITEEMFDFPLIKKPESLESINKSESILNVEPPVEVIENDTKNNSNSNNLDSNSDSSKKVSFDSSSSETNNSEDSSLNKKIINL
jgi:hypothetical protein